MNELVLKTLGYRVLMLVLTVIVAMVVVRDVSIALDIGIVTTVLKTTTYYGYERLWDRR